MARFTHRQLPCTAAALSLAAILAGCQQPKPPPTTKYADLGPHLIPYVDLLGVGDFTLDPAQRRPLMEDSPEDKRVKLILQLRMESINVKDAKFESVVNQLRDRMNASIFVNWTALTEAGVDKNMPVTLNLHEARYERVLDELLNQLGPGKFGYTIDSGVITISTREDLASAKYHLVYVFDIRDLLVIPEANDPAPSDLFTPQKPTVRDKILAEIISRIETTIAPESWRDKGGKVSTIRELNGQLIVNQTLENQRAVNKLLESLRHSPEWKDEVAQIIKSADSDTH